MADNIRATPRNEFLGLLADAMYGGLEYMKDPRRTQQMQGLAGLLESTGIPKTTERMAYGEDLTNIGRANVPLLKPETAEAMMTVAPMVGPAGRLAEQAAMKVGRAGERLAERVVPQVMERGGMGAGLLGDLAQGTRRQIFIGESAKTWNKTAADQAVQMEKAGAKPKDIWSATGTFRSPDGKLRQEISDREAAFIEKGYKNLRRRKEYSDVDPNLSTVLMHEELLKAYPEFSSTTVGKLPYGDGGSASPVGAEKISLGNESKKSMKSSAMHELQHLVQNIEDFNKGGWIGKVKPPQITDEINAELTALRNNFENLKPGSIERRNAVNEYYKLADIYDPYKIYTRIAGEAEARAVQSRMDMTPQERLIKFPLESYDVPVESLLFPTP